MEEVKIVIGKNFGDEGKGAATDWLCRGKNALVVRHNGGAQAGHTVEEGNFRFVFHQLGSGSFQGCPTYWSRTFLPDLLKLGEEMTAFHTAGRSSFPGAVYAHPDCACVTVYDVLLNSLTEQLRGDRKHGSCGMGIFETVLRTERQEYALFLRDFQGADTDAIKTRLRRIRDEYTEARLSSLSTAYPEKFQDSKFLMWTDLIRDENVLHNAAEEMVENYRRYIILSSWPRIAEHYRTVVFENAQGLMLDWDNEEYSPHLTASYTGLKNVAELLKEAGNLSVPTEIFYVTRTYVTRHGAGRLDYECAGEDIRSGMADLTNLPNPWQGALRYGRHPSGNDFFRYIRRDLAYLDGKVSREVILLVNHLDETEGKILFADKDRSPEELAVYCLEQAPGLIHKISVKNRKNVKEYCCSQPLFCEEL